VERAPRSDYADTAVNPVVTPSARSYGEGSPGTRGLDSIPVGVRHDAATRLLLACARPAAEDAPPFARAELTRSDLASLDWARLGQMAAEHGVQPLVYQRLKRCEEVPSAALKAMRAQFYGGSLSNLKLARELVRLTSLLEEAGVPALSFKGPVLAIKARGDLSLRQFNDLDLLVHPEDAGRAAQVLIADRHWPRHFDPANVARSLAQCNEDEFIRHTDLQMIDLHWDLGPRYFPYGPPADLVWRRAVRFPLEGAEVLTMGPLDTILCLAVHGTKHGWTSLSAIYDLAAALALDPHADIGALIAEADQFGCLGMLLLGAALGHKLLGAALPPMIADQIAARPSLAALVFGIERRMFNCVGMRPGLYLDWYVSLRVLPDRRGRLHYLANRALRPAAEDVEFLELPHRLYPLYFPLRPLRLLLQHGKRLFTDVPMWRKPLRKHP
jgi:hypothetical protein